MLEKQATQLPTDIVVRLLRIFPGRTGNIYMPGVYKPGELPKAAYNTYYCTPVNPSDLVEKVIPPVIGDADLKNGSFKVEEMVKREEVKGLTEEISINQQTKGHDKHLKPKLVKPVKAPAIKINSATKEELLALNGVSKSTANKIMNLRDASGFIDYVDLNGRCPLPFGKDWSAFNIEFE